MSSAPWRSGGASLSLIIQGLGVSKQAAGQLVDTLVVRGYVTRAADPADRRRLTLTLTERGLGAAAAIRSAVEQVDADLDRRVGPEYVARAGRCWPRSSRPAARQRRAARQGSTGMVSEPDVSAVPVAGQAAEPGALVWRQAVWRCWSSRRWPGCRTPGRWDETRWRSTTRPRVRSMSMSWHNFIFGAFDPAGTITLDKLPGAFWIQALAVRAFGLHTWVIVAAPGARGRRSPCWCCTGRCGGWPGRRRA